MPHRPRITLALHPGYLLYYPASDCEDRSILFSYLVKQLLGLKVIGLDYPGHIATAVQLNTSIQGDQISYQGGHYTIAEPTYINAKIGMTMPVFKNEIPEVLTIDSGL